MARTRRTRKPGWIVTYQTKELFYRYSDETAAQAKARIQRMFLGQMDGEPQRHFLFDAKIISVSPEVV